MTIEATRTRLSQSVIPPFLASVKNGGITVAASKNPRARSIVVSVFAMELVIVNFGLNIKMTHCCLYLTICHKNVARCVAIMSQDLSC